MQKVLKVAVISGLAAVMFTTSALAMQMSAPDGWYLEGNLGSAHLSNVDYEGGASNNGFAWNLNLGYKFMPYAAIEGGYTSYTQSTIVFDGFTLARISRYSYDIAGKGILPIQDSGFELFAKLGAAHMRASATSTDSDPADRFSASANATNFYAGLGAQFNFMPELGVVVQWQRAQGNHDTGTEDFFSVGLAFIAV